MGREHLHDLASLPTLRDTRGFQAQNKRLACEGRESVTDPCWLVGWLVGTEGHMHMYGPGNIHIALGARTEVGECFVMGEGACLNSSVC